MNAGFESDAPLGLSQISATDFKLTHDLVYYASHQVFRVPAGFVTDLASVPRVVTWLIPRYGVHTPGAVLHDWLWRSEAPAGRIAYRDADGLLRQAMRGLGVSPLRRWFAWAGVRWGALTRRGGRQGWWRTAPAVVGLTLLALPMVALPALTILPALALFTVIDWLVSRVSND